MINSVLLLSQLVVPSIPSNIAPENFVQESIKTISCVGAVEADEIVQALSETSTQNVSNQILIVAVKNSKKTAECAAEVVSTIGGELKLESVMPNLGLFVVSYEVKLDNNVAPCFLTHTCLK